MADTAELGIDNASEEELPQEQVEETVADTELSDETEPGDAGEEPTETEPVDPFASIDDDTLTKHERVQAIIRDREARASESARQRTEAQTTQRLQEQVKNFVTQGGVVQSLDTLVNGVIAKIRPKLEAGETIDSSELAVDRNALQNLGNALYQ